MKTKTKEKILSFVKRALKYKEPKAEGPNITPLACEFLLPQKMTSENRLIKRQLKDLMSDELLKYVKIRKENHPTGAIKVIGLLEVVK